jgi:hypothetical protein
VSSPEPFIRTPRRTGSPPWPPIRAGRLAHRPAPPLDWPFPRDLFWSDRTCRASSSLWPLWPPGRPGRAHHDTTDPPTAPSPRDKCAVGKGGRAAPVVIPRLADAKRCRHEARGCNHPPTHSHDNNLWYPNRVSILTRPSPFGGLHSGPSYGGPLIGPALRLIWPVACP